MTGGAAAAAAGAGGAARRACALAVDAGGSALKYAVVGEDGTLISEPRAVQVDSGGEREPVLQSFARLLSDGCAAAADAGATIAGVGVGFPGPFDYAAATSLMTHKLACLRGLDLRAELRRRVPALASVPMHFAHDVHTFLLGEAWRGAARSHGRVVAITIGTGLGIGFMADGVIVHDGRGGPLKSLYRTPCRGRILEDFVSRRGLTEAYRGRRGEAIDPREIEQRARAGDRAALRVYEEMGDVLGEHARPLLEEFGAECLVLGGRISKAFDLFAGTLRKRLEGLPALRGAAGAALIDEAALLGAARLVFDPAAAVGTAAAAAAGAAAPHPAPADPAQGGKR